MQKAIKSGLTILAAVVVGGAALAAYRWESAASPAPQHRWNNTEEIKATPRRLFKTLLERDPRYDWENDWRGPTLSVASASSSVMTERWNHRRSESRDRTKS